MTAIAQAAPLPAVQGYVEAISDQRVHGWAWSPASPEARLRVELRRGEAVLQAVVAELPRADLASNGVGDGAHAFVLDLGPELTAADAGFDVVAIAPDGSETALAAPPPPVLATGGESVRRALEGLAASQRVMHRNLQAVLMATRGREPIDAALERIAATQAALDARTAELELFVTRLDERLATLATTQAPPQPARGMRWAQAGAAALVAIGTAGVLLHLLG